VCEVIRVPTTPKIKKRNFNSDKGTWKD
jgi:hypothetical protein